MALEIRAMLCYLVHLQIFIHVQLEGTLHHQCWVCPNKALGLGVN